MATPQPSLGRRELAEAVAAACTPVASGRVGLELEWHTYPLDDPTRRPVLAQLDSVLAQVRPAEGCRLSIEPGGQIEISSAPSAHLGELHSLVDESRRSLLEALGRIGLGAASVAHDPIRPPSRLDIGPRYRAMAAYLGAQGPEGPAMMASTVSIQVNVDLGRGEVARRRWRLAHDLGPVLTATFANSPFAGGLPTGWRSTRMRLWERIDSSRTRAALDTGDPVADWVAFAMAARVMLIRSGPQDFEPVEGAMSLARWAEEGHRLGFPDLDDVCYHLTTLFPPVRLRGWLELRMIDALPDPWWRVASAMVGAALLDPEAAATMSRACRGTQGLGREAARHGLAHPALAAAARRCMQATLAALDGLGCDDLTREACAAYQAMYVDRGRTPADSLLETYRREGTMGFPEPLVAGLSRPQ